MVSTPDFTHPLRLTRRAFFYQVQVAQNTVTVTWGQGTAPGRTTVKTFPTPADAIEWAVAAVDDKNKAGYIAPSTPAAPPLRRSTRKRAAKPAPPAPPAPRTRAKKPKVQPKPTAPPKVKRGLRGAPAPDVSAPLGVVDPASGLTGSIYTAVEDGEERVYDVMLALVDTPKNHDKFIVLQLVELDDRPAQIAVYQRWGRTGTSGSSTTQKFPLAKLNSALKAFSSKFEEKTGLEWATVDETPVPGKYRVVMQDFVAKYQASVSDAPRWQYWVDDGVDGKKTGWYDYDQFGNSLVEQLYMEFQSNPWLIERIVQSGSYSYLVNLESMTQTNVIHANHTIRHIRRVSPGELPDNEAPTDDFIIPGGIDSTHVHTLATVAKKPNVLPSKTKPRHAVTAAPPAKVIATPKTKTKTNAKNKANTKTKKKSKTQTKTTPKTRAKTEDEVETTELPDPGEPASEGVIPVDDMCPNASLYEVVGDFDATLNQSNIIGGNNNNKYYRLQLLQNKKTSAFNVWTRWGRVGESRGTQTKLMGPFKEQEAAEKTFGKKFSDKTANAWSDRASFTPQYGKYEMLEIDHTAKKEEDAEPLVMTLKPADGVEYLPSTLPRETQKLIELLFETDMYTDALKAFDIDVRKMPLGALSTSQIEKGIAVLEEIEDAISTGHNRQRLEELSSKFYTVLPHDFGRRRPPVIQSEDILQRSYDMCNVLLDMEKATNLMSEAAEKTLEQKAKKKVPHPTEAQYASLNASLRLVQPGSDEHAVVSAAFEETKGGYASSKLLNVWRVDRKGEAQRFKKVQHFDNHLLLWHGSHIGAISAILATGLRIMPHSGGRVGRGIYLASENGKSQDYTTPACKSRIGCMFLAQAAMGRMYEIVQDNSSLRKAPKGYDSVLACGEQTPAGFKDVDIDEDTVQVPIKKPKKNPKGKSSSFYQDEYLIYREEQARIRYVITVKK